MRGKELVGRWCAISLVWLGGWRQLLLALAGGWFAFRAHSLALGYLFEKLGQEGLSQVSVMREQWGLRWGAWLIRVHQSKETLNKLL